MAATTPATSDTVARQAQELGDRIRSRRKALGVTMVAAAEAAGMSRVTWHRIEKGNPSVTMGAWLAAASALALDMEMQARNHRQDPRPDDADWIPARIRLSDYPQLGQLAWQLDPATRLTPGEAFNLYERNWRHLDRDALQPRERALITALQRAFAENGHV